MEEKNFAGYTVDITGLDEDLFVESRPWGWFETLHDDKTYKVKRLFVRPHQRISYSIIITVKSTGQLCQEVVK